jgi:hypothetical protein
MTVIAIGSLVLAVASLLVVGGAVFALALFFPLFALALAAVIARTDDTVRQRNPSMDAKAWRDHRASR